MVVNKNFLCLFFVLSLPIHSKCNSLLNRLEKAYSYCMANNYNANICVLVDFSIPSGTNRFFICDLHDKTVSSKGICLHGNGAGNTREKPVFSNKVGSNCSSLGKYKITGCGYMKSYPIPVIKLVGLERTNSNAKQRGIYIHPALTPTLAKVLPNPKYLPLTIESQGCFSIDLFTFLKLRAMVEKSDKPVLLWAYQ